ncbi:uncharacterized protein ColSpa_00948 [Colletotrichum spaethianum]|uniref:Uncharacterized protein n=1 Tax=Colletotrichum spaethianum TaxID=700344 RepID=A0AA37LAI1_9PEZI|nr:uncharacterized protein ColSpa_00948 [Colletotrichum spaethianum]GKT40767.1 hypothetical protein ColSpa_00948 [Colletotrichum spaethianum]
MSIRYNVTSTRPPALSPTPGLATKVASFGSSLAASSALASGSLQLSRRSVQRSPVFWRAESTSDLRI